MLELIASLQCTGKEKPFSSCFLDTHAEIDGKLISQFVCLLCSHIA